jgi:hypothetical protein
MSELPLTTGGSQPSRPLVFLTLCIGTTLYVVRRFTSEPPRAQHGLRLQKLPTGTLYEVVVGGPAPHCNCPDFLFRRKDQHGKCKHIRALEQLLFLHPTKSAVLAQGDDDAANHGGSQRRNPGDLK